MELLCNHYTTELAFLDKEIEKLYKENGLITSDELFPTWEGTLKAKLKIYVAEILKTKEKKIIRDKLSYDNNQAYNWAQTKNRRCNNKTRNSKESTIEPNHSDSSASFTSSSQAPDHTRITKTQVSFKPKNGKDTAQSGIVKRTPEHKDTYEHSGSDCQNFSLFLKWSPWICI